MNRMLWFAALTAALIARGARADFDTLESQANVYYPVIPGGSVSYDYARAQFTVPALPTVNSGQQLQMFIGLGSTSYLDSGSNATTLETILTYSSGAYSIVAQACTDGVSPACQSGTVRSVSPGDSLGAYVLGSSCVHDNPDYYDGYCTSFTLSITDFTTSQSSTVTWANTTYGSHSANRPFGFLIAGAINGTGFSSCSALPPSGYLGFGDIVTSYLGTTGDVDFIPTSIGEWVNDPSGTFARCNYNSYYSVSCDDDDDECSGGTGITWDASPYYVLNYASSNDQRSTLGDWDPGSLYLKGDCGTDESMTGIAQTTTYNQSNGALCRQEPSGFFPGASCHVLTFSGTGDSRETTSSGDWAYGYYKNECATGYYIAGVSVIGDSDGVHAILCCPSVEVAHTSCTGRTYDSTTSRESGSDPTNWDSSDYRAECGTNRYATGLSVSTTRSRGHSLLCCN